MTKEPKKHTKGAKPAAAAGATKEKEEASAQPEFANDNERIESEFKQIINDPCKMLYMKSLGNIQETIFCESQTMNKFKISTGRYYYFA